MVPTRDEGDCLVAFEAAGHVAEVDASDRPDPSAFTFDPSDGVSHNGYECSRCGEVVCIHCFARTEGIGIPIRPCPVR